MKPPANDQLQSEPSSAFAGSPGGGTVKVPRDEGSLVKAYLNITNGTESAARAVFMFVSSEKADARPEPGATQQSS